MIFYRLYAAQILCYENFLLYANFRVSRGAGIGSYSFEKEWKTEKKQLTNELAWDNI